jgi:DNA-binding response OmpR family regulator
MITTEDSSRVAVLFERLARMQIITKAIFGELQTIFEHSGGFDESLGVLANLLGTHSDPAVIFAKPIIDSAAMTVTWRGRSCKLGNTVLFRLMERLARRSCWQLSYSRLINEVWDGQCRSDETVRSTVRHLKSRLKRAGMGGLAKAIHSNKRHCYLELDTIR